ncbi:MAG TPA: DmsE family decaheme c-type cytochrome [Myxococcota bacterium]|nr:DmsE family decaheme c-type cytochrome [Myxococcota bacterium]
MREPSFRQSLLLAAALVTSAASAARAADYVGDAACTACHDKLQAPYAATVHGKLFHEDARSEAMRHGCEGCHGPGSAHVDAGGGKGVGGLITFRAEGPEAIERENGVCLACHSAGARTHWDGSTHQMRDVACTSCHAVMRAVSPHGLLTRPSESQTCAQCHLLESSKTMRYGHMPLRAGSLPERDGKMSCLSCHNPHGTVSESLLAAHSINEGCYTCHADKRGPFLWEHAPVPENCLNCHDPHGSSREAMLRMSPPRLCQTCHDPTRHPTDPRLPTNQFVIGSGCMQCHVNIHGSNHPSGFGLTR